MKIFISQGTEKFLSCEKIWTNVTLWISPLSNMIDREQMTVLWTRSPFRSRMCYDKCNSDLSRIQLPPKKM